MVDISHRARSSPTTAPRSPLRRTELAAYHRPALQISNPTTAEEAGSGLRQIFADGNTGVLTGLAFRRTQEAYEKASRPPCFARLDWGLRAPGTQRSGRRNHHEVRCSGWSPRWCASIRLTGHFQVNRQKLAEIGALGLYARTWFPDSGFGDTIDFVHIKRHYYHVATRVAPRHQPEPAIVPDGPGP